MKYVSVVICKKPGDFEAPLIYGINQACRVGQLVKVPLRQRMVQGIIVEVLETAPRDFDIEKIREVSEVVTFVSLSEGQMQLAGFIADYYCTSLVRALRLMMPKTIWEGKIRAGEHSPFTDPISFRPFSCDLTPAQGEALSLIQTADRPILLHGVTGSGKTEIYLRAIVEAAKKGKQSLLLTPEIALTPQLLHYFKDFFGDRIAVFHSRLTDKKRAEEWLRVKTGETLLVIGSRSAIFAPVDQWGVIILDEEHEWTYKQESAPYYETHCVAEQLCKQHGAQLILGSATPRLESYQKALAGDYQLIALKERIHQANFPSIRVVDLRDEFKKKNFSIFSLVLQNKIKEKLAKNEQIILFVNQRGLARAVVCRDCGYTEECPHCDISLKYHRASGGDQLICHYCGFKKSPPVICPGCQSSFIKHVGVGTQRVEEEAHRLFPLARIIRADRDTTGKSEGFKPIYKDFLAHKYDILIGTQMVAKGLDFAKVSLVGIILADVGLHVPDFRSTERLFQIITQVAGRCGRSQQDSGEVILQTYQPEHFAITQAAQYDYGDFAEKELGFRKKLGYPPFNRLIKFTIIGRDQNQLRDHITSEQEALEDIFNTQGLPVKIVNAPALVSRVADRYYWHVFLKGEKPAAVFRYWRLPKGWHVDIDPIHTA